MKNKIFTLLLAGMAIFSSCDSDRDSNPVYNQPETFTLNKPALSDNIFDLNSSSHIWLTCSQPDYGFTAAVTYTLEISLTDNFEKVQVLPTQFTTAKMEVKTNELAVCATNLFIAEGKVKDDFPLQTPLYLRLKAVVTDLKEPVYSNSIEIKTELEYTLPPIEIPKKLYIGGDFCEWNWDKTLEMVPVNGTEGMFWRIIYIPENTSIKLSRTSTEETSAGFAETTINDNYEADVTDNSGKIGFTKGGWYLLVVKAAIEGAELRYTMDINEPAVYIVGPVTSNNESDRFNVAPEKKFTVPAIGDDFFVSPPFKFGVSGDPGVRACVSIDGIDWWKTEFMVFDGILKYRGNDGDQARVSANAGQKLYINFTAGTGKIE